MTPATPDEKQVQPLSENTLLGGRVLLRQPEHGYRVAIDPVLLAAAVPLHDGERVLDAGTGTGAAALCLCERVPGCTVIGLELQAELAELAERNAALNDASARFTVVRGNLLSPPDSLDPGSFDHAMANPPYLERGKASAAAEKAKAVANMEGEATLADWVAFCAAMVRRRGSVTMVHRADRLDALLSSFRRSGLGGIVVLPLWPKGEGRDARRAIVSGRKGGRAPLRLSRGLVLHRDDGSFTPETEKILRGGAALAL